MIIAVDGPAGAGKGTLARALAYHFDLAYLDTGLLYRAIGFRALQQGVALDDSEALENIAQTLEPQDLGRGELRSDEAGGAASLVAVCPGVRRALLDFQREFAENPPHNTRGAVLDGRDIGTQICPNADVKLFITASVEVRAERRCKELQNRGIESIYTSVLKDMVVRDERDSQRAASPLRPAPDAFVIDTSSLTPQDVFDKAVAIVEQRFVSASPAAK